MTGRVEWVTDRARFGELREAWDRLAHGPFQRHAWYDAWWSSFSTGRRLAICAVWRTGELVAVLPLCRHGLRLEAMTNVHSPVFEPLARDPAASAEVLDAALSAQGGEIRLSPLPREGLALDRSLDACGRARRLVALEPQHVSPITDTTGDFAGYRAPRKRAWREIERRSRRLAREHTPEIRLVEPPADLERELSRGIALEASGWKGKERTAMASHDDTRTFYESVARAFHASGELALSSIAVDGRLVAFDLALLEGDRYWLLKTGYDEAFRSLAPGLVLRRHVIERCFEVGLSAHEFLGHTVDWKRPFATGERAHVRLLAYRRRPDGLIGYGLRRLARPAAARVYRRLRPERSRSSSRPVTDDVARASRACH
jgi:CelD/BcsL family acetyltransferase involved in cellulose biosynthesis